MSKKTFVYDTSKGFSSMIKQYFSEKMDIDICTNKKNFKNYKMSDYEVCFFTVNDIEDLFLLKKVYYEIEHFFITSPRKTIYEKVMNLKYEDAVYIDFDYSKKDIVYEINYNLSLNNII